MVKAILILKKSGSCRYYRVYNDEWRKDDIQVGIVSYLTAITSIITELGETSPKNLEFEDFDIICETKNDYILAIVKDQHTKQSVVKRVKNEFKSNFRPLVNEDDLNSLLAEESFLLKEQKYISRFARHLNLIINKRVNLETEIAVESKDEDSDVLLISDVDLLIATSSGQPVYMMTTLLLPYDAVLFSSFVSAILDLGQLIGIGKLKKIEGEKLTIFFKVIQKAFAIVITQNKNQKKAYQRFAEFVAEVCNDWLSFDSDGIEGAFEIFENRKQFEQMLQIILDSETWEKHLIKEQEREIIAVQTIENF